jgi:hypothetical protein
VSHGREHSNKESLAALLVLGLDLAGKVVRPLRKLDVLTHISLIVHETAESILGDIHKSVLVSLHIGGGGVVTGRDDVFVFLAIEDINGGEVTLRVAVLASLGSRNI